MVNRAIIIGGTGATGSQVIKQLLKSDSWDKVTSIGRKPVLNGEKHNKLNDIVFENLFDMSTSKDIWQDHDVFFNCIGTTRKRAGGPKKFVEIESGLSLIASKMASGAGIPHASLISANGANHKQWSKDWIHPLLYLKTMGEKEQSILKGSFKKVSIFRPGMLIRSIKNVTFFDQLLSFSQFGLRIDKLASAMINDVLIKNDLEDNSSIRFYIGNKSIIQKSTI